MVDVKANHTLKWKINISLFQNICFCLMLPDCPAHTHVYSIPVDQYHFNANPNLRLNFVCSLVEEVVIVKHKTDVSI